MYSNRHIPQLPPVQTSRLQKKRLRKESLGSCAEDAGRAWHEHGVNTIGFRDNARTLSGHVQDVLGLRRVREVTQNTMKKMGSADGPTRPIECVPNDMQNREGADIH